MKRVRIHRHLQDVFGEEQSSQELVAIILFGMAAPIVLAIASLDLVSTAPLWRSALALLLVLDIAAGSVANFTRATNDFYAVRPRHRWVFIAIHVHVVAVALLLGADVVLSIMVWGYTIAGAVVVNLLFGRPSQTFVGGLLLAMGLVGIALWPAPSSFMSAVCALFMLKVLFSFAVDHYRSARMQAAIGAGHG